MQKMSGLELSYAVSELAHLQGKRIAKIRRTESGVFLFKIGSEELLFEPGVRLHLTRQALSAKDSPDGFTSYLRKNFEGKTASSISQVPNERIVEITTKSKERLVFELFRTGNLIAVAEDSHPASQDGAPLPEGKAGRTIAACMQTDDAGGRRVARGEKYSYPKATPFAPKIPPKIGFFVQENERGEPLSFSLDAAKGGREFPSLSDALDHYYANQKTQSGDEKAAQAKIAKLEERLKSQEESLTRMGEEKGQAKKAGDAIWADLEGIDALCALVRQMKKEGKGDGEINAKLSKKGARLDGTALEIEIGSE